MVAARFRDIRIVLQRLRNPGRKSFAGYSRLEGTAELFEPGTLWNWLGRAGSRDGVLRHRAAIRENAQTICEQAHRVAPVGAGKTLLDDHGNREGTNVSA